MQSHNLTLCVYGRDVAPVVSLDDVHHGFGLLHIRWHHPHEIFIQALLAFKWRSDHVNIADFWKISCGSD